MIEKFTISRDDSIYEAFPDVVLTPTGRLICIFTEMIHHADRGYTRVMIAKSDDRGRTWAPKEGLSPPHYLDKGEYSYNCPRIGMMPDGRIYALCDEGRKNEKNEPVSNIVFWFSGDNGDTWTDPIRILKDAGGMPDRLVVLPSGRWLLGLQTRLPDGVLKQHLYYSDDNGSTWIKTIIAEVHGLQLCEVSVMRLPDGTLAALMRENSGEGWDCYKSLSTDDGANWGPVHRMPLPGCHRPVAGMLQSGRVLITYRFMQGGKGWVGFWTQNVFAALTDVESIMQTDRKQQWSRIMPIDFDRSPVSDIGYTGWIQFSDGEIYMVGYCLDDSPKAQIRGYSYSEKDFILD